MMSTPEPHEKEKRFVYNKDFLLKRRETAASKFWPKSLSKRHINGLGLWDPVSFCKYVAKEEKLKRSKKPERTREVRDGYNQQYYPPTDFNGYPSRPTSACYLRNNYEYDVYYEDEYDRFGVYEYVEAEGDYYYPAAQPAGRKRSSRPRRTRPTGRSSALGSNAPTTGEHGQPEWFSCGPTSHLDMINLEGFPSKGAQTDRTNNASSTAMDSSPSPVAMEVVLGNTCAANDKENNIGTHDQQSKVRNEDKSEQYERDIVSKQLLRLIQNGPQNTSIQVQPHLPPEVKEAATSAELETALKGLLFKEKDSNAKQEQEDIFSKLRAKGMMNGQVKTVAELEGHPDVPSEKESESKDTRSGIKVQNSTQPKGYSSPDSGDQSAYYRLIGMMRANGSFDDMPNAKYRGSGNHAPYKSYPSNQNGSRQINSSGPVSSAITTSTTNAGALSHNAPKQSPPTNQNCDNTNNNSIKQQTTNAATVAAVAAAAAATRLQNPLAQPGLFRGAHPSAAAAAAVAASMTPLLPQQHAHLPPHLFPSHSQFLSAALFKQLPQAQAHLSSQQAFGSMANRPTKPCIPQAPLLYYAMAQQAQLQQQHHQQQQHNQQQQLASHPQKPQHQAQLQQKHHLQHQHQDVQNIVGKAAVALQQQANKSQQSNATAAKVCIKKNSQSPPTKQKPSAVSDNFDEYRNGNIKDGKKTLSESDISSSMYTESENTQHSAHSTPGRRVSHRPDSEELRADANHEHETQSSQTLVESNKIVVSNATIPSVPPATLTQLPAMASIAPVSSAYTLVPPQRIAPPMQSSVAAINNLFRLPQGYSPSLPPSMRLHQTAANGNSESVQMNGGLGKWFGSDLIGTHRLIGLPPLPTDDTTSGRVRTVDDIEKR